MSKKDKAVDKNKLEAIDKKIRYHIGSIKKSYMFIGKYLSEMKPMVSDIQEYAFNQYGFKKSTTYNMMRVFKEFGSLGMEDYSYTQLVDMLSMTPEEREHITPDMSVSEIREAKKKNKQLEQVSNKLENDSQDNSSQLENDNTKDSNKLESGNQIDLDIFPQSREKMKGLYDWIETCILDAEKRLKDIPDTVNPERLIEVASLNTEVSVLETVKKQLDAFCKEHDISA